jgi:hypothetical protein
MTDCGRERSSTLVLPHGTDPDSHSRARYTRREQWICHQAKHCQRNDFCGFTKQVGYSSLENLLDHTKISACSSGLATFSDILTRDGQCLPDRFTRPFEQILEKTAT